MPKVDFTKTPSQVRREIEKGLEGLSRSLDASKGHKERGTGALFHVVTVLLVLVGNSAFAFLGPTNSTFRAQHTAETNISARDAKSIGDFLARIDTSIDGIEQSRNRVAPAMPIDGQIASARTSVAALRNLVLSTGPGIQKKN